MSLIDEPDFANPSQEWLDIGWDVYDFDYLTEVLDNAFVEMETGGSI